MPEVGVYRHGEGEADREAEKTRRHDVASQVKTAFSDEKVKGMRSEKESDF